MRNVVTGDLFQESQDMNEALTGDLFRDSHDMGLTIHPENNNNRRAYQEASKGQSKHYIQDRTAKIIQKILRFSVCQFTE